ncbi:hypothetical protein M569_05784, partial [Genlisea aurea]
AASASAPPRKRLVFDRRYGWVFDDWREPCDEALSGGRGMFCILPLAKAAIEKSSEMINSVLEILEKPEENLSPKALRAAFDNRIREITSSLKNS